MLQKKESEYRESISMEEYLNKRKRKRKENEAGREGSFYFENGQWMLATLYI